MGGTVDDTLGREASNIGVPSIYNANIVMNVGEAFSEPIFLGGHKVVSIQFPTLAVTNVFFEAANFTTNTDKTDQKSGFIRPLAANFDPLQDQSGSVVEVTATTGGFVLAMPDVGFPLWIRIVLSVAQTVTFRITAKG